MYGMDSSPPSRFRLLTSDPDWVLVERYFSGESTPEERQAIDAWAMADPSHARLLAGMRTVWREAATPLPVVDEAEAWRALQERLRAAPLPTKRTRILPEHPGRSWRAMAVAAGLIAVGIALTATWRRVETVRLAAAPPRIYETARGERSQVTLVDGTHVWLNVDSRLVVPAAYGTTRDVALIGEAYFVVQHDARRPFRVHAGTGVMDDLGTEFAVRAYPSDTNTVVIVAGGRVGIRPAEITANLSAAQLGRGQMATLDRSGAVQVVDHADLDTWLAWVGGHLAFSERPLRDVLGELERWYDIQFAVDDSTLLTVPITAAFTSQSADNAMAILAGTLGVPFTRDGRYVHIHHAAQRGALKP